MRGISIDRSKTTRADRDIIDNLPDELRGAQPPVDAGALCGQCRQAVMASDDRSIRGACRHVYHTACLVPLIKSGRQYCGECPVPARTNEEARRYSGYTIDSGNDNDLREAVSAELEYRRDKVRERLITSAATTIQHGTRAHRRTRGVVVYSWLRAHCREFRPSTFGAEGAAWRADQGRRSGGAVQ